MDSYTFWLSSVQFQLAYPDSQRQRFLFIIEPKAASHGEGRGGEGSLERADSPLWRSASLVLSPTLRALLIPIEYEEAQKRETVHPINPRLKRQSFMRGNVPTSQTFQLFPGGTRKFSRLGGSRLFQVHYANEACLCVIGNNKIRLIMLSGFTDSESSLFLSLQNVRAAL